MHIRSNSGGALNCIRERFLFHCTSYFRRAISPNSGFIRDESTTLTQQEEHWRNGRQSTAWSWVQYRERAVRQYSFFFFKAAGRNTAAFLSFSSPPRLSPLSLSLSLLHTGFLSLPPPSSVSRHFNRETADRRPFNRVVEPSPCKVSSSEWLSHLEFNACESQLARVCAPARSNDVCSRAPVLRATFVG